MSATTAPLWRDVVPEDIHRYRATKFVADGAEVLTARRPRSPVTVIAVRQGSMWRVQKMRGGRELAARESERPPVRLIETMKNARKL